MNINEFAQMLNGREYRHEYTDTEERQAKALGFVIVHGYSDDNVEFAGAISEEVGCYEGGIIHLNKDGIIEERDECEDCKHYQKSLDDAKIIEALWCEEGDYSWTYKTDIPHATFEIMEDDEKYCRGIVFELKSLG